MNMKNRIITVASWLIVTWICYVFLSSLPYKFYGHPDTQHIFGTIGPWIGSFLGDTVGNGFIDYGAYLIGGFEFLTSIVLLSPALFFLLKIANIGGDRLPQRHIMHTLGGVMAMAVMCGAVFFHLVSPLGIEVLHEGQSDHGSLFYAATSIVVLGAVLALINFTLWRRH